MYRYLDRTLDQLDAQAVLIVAAMRDWVVAASAGRCPCNAVAHRFARAGLHDIAGDFGMAMFTLNGDGLASLRFSRPGSAQVTDDEAKLLTLFDAPLDQPLATLQRLAATLVHDAAVHRLSHAASIVAVHLAESQIALRHD